MMKKKCARCGKEMANFTLVLWMGPQGFRRYPMDDKCKALVEKKATVKVERCAEIGQR
jgi:hypothetical protein